MARTTSLQNMSVEQLLELQKRVNATLSERRGDLETQLRQLESYQDGGKIGRGKRGVSALKGSKVGPKYRDPKTGATWSGRGAKAKWLVSIMKDSGKKLEDFLIDKSATSKKKIRRKK